MKRKIYNDLLKWKADACGSSALLIEGARRIGKSYIVEEFAKNEYDSYLLINFSSAPELVKSWFDLYLEDLDELFVHLQLHYKKKLVSRRSLVIFDEVQCCPRAREAIKWLVADGRYDYIETGSLISIKKNVKDIVIPSEEQSVEMFPMDFEEFVWAMGEEMLLEYAHKQFEEMKPMGDFHRKMMMLFRQYMIVGGMPQAVAEYAESRDFERVDKVKRNILNLYRNDINKYADRAALRVSAIFNDIPSQLQRHERTFNLSSLGENARMRNYEDAFFWLNDAKVINCCYNTTEPNLGLRMNENRTRLKCYMGDTGLLISHTFDERGIVTEEIYQKMIYGKLEANLGMLMENVVAQMLRAAGHRLFFLSLNSTEVDDRMEIDFLIRKRQVTSRHNICPIEVKSGSRYTLKSITKCMTKYADYVASPIVLHDKDLMVKGGITYLPLYMTLWL